MNSFIEVIQPYGPLFGILAAVATVLGLAFTIYKTAHDRQVKSLQHRINELVREGGGALGPLVEQLQKGLEQAEGDLGRLRVGFATAEDAWQTQRLALQEQEARNRGTIESLTEDLEGTREELAAKDRADQTRLNLLKRAMRLQGKVWERKVLQSAPRFRPLSDRHAPIVSVLNLKGGVGKTTVTAHLGAALSAKGYNVLMMDLDLQGSLSSLFMSESALVERSKEKRLLQHFLLHAAENRKANLLEYCVPIFDSKSAIIPNADSMAYAELNLTMQWLLRLGKRDTRFLLRKALQQKRVTNRFDVVLLDCPPLFNTCCVNALAVSDYIVIPVVPSKKAAERVPLLLERLQSLHEVINPQLQVMGVLLNRTHGASLTSWEQDLWGDMLERGKDRWRLPVHAFETSIRQTTEVREGETEFSSPLPGSELYTLFSRLVTEVEARLPGDCLRITSVPLGPG